MEIFGNSKPLACHAEVTGVGGKLRRWIGTLPGTLFPKCSRQRRHEALGIEASSDSEWLREHSLTTVDWRVQRERAER